MTFEEYLEIKHPTFYTNPFLTKQITTLYNRILSRINKEINNDEITLLYDYTISLFLSLFGNHTIDQDLQTKVCNTFLLSDNTITTALNFLNTNKIKRAILDELIPIVEDPTYYLFQRIQLSTKNDAISYLASIENDPRIINGCIEIIRYTNDRDLMTACSLIIFNNDKDRSLPYLLLSGFIDNYANLIPYEHKFYKKNHYFISNRPYIYKLNEFIPSIDLEHSNEIENYLSNRYSLFRTATYSFTLKNMDALIYIYQQINNYLKDHLTPSNCKTYFLKQGLDIQDQSILSILLLQFSIYIFDLKFYNPSSCSYPLKLEHFLKNSFIEELITFGTTISLSNFNLISYENKPIEVPSKSPIMEYLTPNQQASIQTNKPLENALLVTYNHRFYPPLDNEYLYPLLYKQFDCLYHYFTSINDSNEHEPFFRSLFLEPQHIQLHDEELKFFLDYLTWPLEPLRFSLQYIEVPQFNNRGNERRLPYVDDTVTVQLQDIFEEYFKSLSNEQRKDIFTVSLSRHSCRFATVYNNSYSEFDKKLLFNDFAIRKENLRKALIPMLVDQFIETGDLDPLRFGIIISSNSFFPTYVPVTDYVLPVTLCKQAISLTTSLYNLLDSLTNKKTAYKDKVTYIDMIQLSFSFLSFHYSHIPMDTLPSKQIKILKKCIKKKQFDIFFKEVETLTDSYTLTEDIRTYYNISKEGYLYRWYDPKGTFQQFFTKETRRVLWSMPKYDSYLINYNGTLMATMNLFNEMIIQLNNEANTKKKSLDQYISKAIRMTYDQLLDFSFKTIKSFLPNQKVTFKPEDLFLQEYFEQQISQLHDYLNRHMDLFLEDLHNEKDVNNSIKLASYITSNMNQEALHFFISCIENQSSSTTKSMCKSILELNIPNNWKLIFFYVKDSYNKNPLSALASKFLTSNYSNQQISTYNEIIKQPVSIKQLETLLTL